MKKKVAIFISMILAMSVLVACTSKQAVTEPKIKTNVVEAAEPFDMDEEELKELYLKLYREKAKDENFISDIEQTIYKEVDLYIRNKEVGFVTDYNELYDESREYYYPILLPDTSEPIIAYTDEYGKLCVYNASTDRHDYYNNIHVQDEVECIDTSANYSVVFKKGTIELWEFGTKTIEVKIPADSKYVGYSYWEGYLFRSNGDVYSVQLKEQEDGSPKFVSEVIAHNVQEVLVTNYKLNSDAWEQPLFLMNDGTIKAYCVWAGDQDAPRDDESHLVQPTCEGGWK